LWQGQTGIHISSRQVVRDDYKDEYQKLQTRPADE